MDFRTFILFLISVLPCIARGESALQNADIGNVALEGGASIQDGKLVIQGSGLGVEQPGDSFHYVWQANQGDYAITAKIAPGSNAEGAIVIRETENPSAPGLWVGFNAAGKINIVSRAAENGAVGRTELDAGGTEPIWLRVVRTGNALALAYSDDGVAWDEFHQASIALPERSLAGFGVAGADVDVAFEGFGILASAQTSEEENGAASGEGSISTSGSNELSNSQQSGGSSTTSTGTESGGLAPTDQPQNTGETARRKIYVNKQLGNDANDGLTSLKSGEQGPKKTIQAALALAQKGDEIVIASGTYTISEISPAAEIIITPVGEVVIGP